VTVRIFRPFKYEVAVKQNGLHFEIPEPVIGLCRTIAEAGEKAYVVGGAIRDMQLGDFRGDFDLATSATPAEITGLFKKVIPTGIKHGTVMVLVAGEGYEVTTLRGEGPYSDGRHPDRVAFLKDITADLARRDFTANAMAWDPLDEVLHDPFGGAEDIDRRILRAVGDPAERFAEDGLRVLRAARFAATLGFTIEPRTLAAIPAAAPTLDRVSIERKRDELKKMLGAKAPSAGLHVMARTGLLGFVSRKLEAIAETRADDDRWRRTLDRVDAIAESMTLRLAALLLDIGGPDGPADRAQAHDRARGWLTQMRFDRKTIEAVTELVRRSDFDYRPDWSDADVRRFMSRSGRDGLPSLLAIRRADLKAGSDPDEALTALENLARRIAVFAKAGVPLSTGDLKIDGTTLMQSLDLSPGPRVGTLLEQLLAVVIENPEANERDALLAAARSLTASDQRSE
jgi:tRNA nucleotidyltransferase (CCA-adding enzyme)